MRVLVSGAGGYLGSRVLPILPVEAEGYQSVHMDLRFPFENFRMLEQIRPDAVVAVAYINTDAANANPQMALLTDVAGIKPCSTHAPHSECQGLYTRARSMSTASRQISAIPM